MENKRVEERYFIIVKEDYAFKTNKVMRDPESWKYDLHGKDGCVFGYDLENFYKHLDRLKNYSEIQIIKTYNINTQELEYNTRNTDNPFLGTINRDVCAIRSMSCIDRIDNYDLLKIEDVYNMLNKYSEMFTSSTIKALHEYYKENEKLEVFYDKFLFIIENPDYSNMFGRFSWRKILSSSTISEEFILKNLDKLEKSPNFDFTFLFDYSRNMSMNFLREIFKKEPKTIHSAFSNSKLNEDFIVEHLNLITRRQDICNIIEYQPISETFIRNSLNDKIKEFNIDIEICCKMLENCNKIKECQMKVNEYESKIKKLEDENIKNFNHFWD